MMANQNRKPIGVDPFGSFYSIDLHGQVQNIKSGKILAWGRKNSNSPFVVLLDGAGNRQPFTVSKLVEATFPGKAMIRANAAPADSTQAAKLEGLALLNHLREKAGKPALKSWKQSKQALAEAIKKLSN